jgi:hypothetical protein
MHAYETKSDEDSMEALAKKLTDDLRKNIRALNDFSPLTEEWDGMADSLARIASITEMEQKIPKDNEDATLLECEELALRYILEDGKLNLCLRSLSDYQGFKNSATGSNASAPEKEAMLKFETNMGVVLKNAWMHIEALQTTDLPLLIGYITDVMSQASTMPEELESLDELGSRAEAMVIHYLHGMCKRLDQIDEGRVMPFVNEKRVLGLAAAHLHTYHTKLSEDDLLKGAQALAMICDSEDFDVRPGEYIQTDADKRALVSLRDDFIRELTEDDLDIRRSVRPLLDQIDKAERDLPSK